MINLFTFALALPNKKDPTTEKVEVKKEFVCRHCSGRILLIHFDQICMVTLLTQDILSSCQVILMLMSRVRRLFSVSTFATSKTMNSKSITNGLLTQRLNTRVKIVTIFLPPSSFIIFKLLVITSHTDDIFANFTAYKNDQTEVNYKSE